MAIPRFAGNGYASPYVKLRLVCKKWAAFLDFGKNFDCILHNIAGSYPISQPVPGGSRIGFEFKCIGNICRCCEDIRCACSDCEMDSFHAKFHGPEAILVYWGGPGHRPLLTVSAWKGKITQISLADGRLFGSKGRLFKKPNSPSGPWVNNFLLDNLDPFLKIEHDFHAPPGYGVLSMLHWLPAALMKTYVRKTRTLVKQS